MADNYLDNWIPSREKRTALESNKDSKGRDAKRLQHLVVVELAAEQLKIPGKSALYVLRTQRNPEDVFSDLVMGLGPNWINGSARRLRPDLVPKYKPTCKRDVAKSRLDKLKIDLARRGYAVNGDTRTWRVYVLDVDADGHPPLENRGKLGKVVYVGQTSATLAQRLAQHRGEVTSKSGRYIGSPSLRGRNVTLNLRLTPSRILFTEGDAKKFETETHKKLEHRGFRVLGDTI